MPLLLGITCMSHYIRQHDKYDVLIQNSQSVESQVRRENHQFKVRFYYDTIVEEKIVPLPLMHLPFRNPVLSRRH